MKQKRFNWEIWLKNKKKLEDSFEFFLKKKSIAYEGESKFLPISHLKKAEYNLEFVNFLNSSEKFYDWIIVGCYYTIYHSTLALITKKGFSSKNHLATLCALIKFYYTQENTLTKEEIELVSKSSLEKEEISYLAYAKEKRETASYGLSEEFNRLEAKDLLKNTIRFLNKTRGFRMKKILILNYEFPPLGGGASPVSYELGKGYAKMGHSVSVVTMGVKR